MDSCSRGFALRKILPLVAIQLVLATAAVAQSQSSTAVSNESTPANTVSGTANGGGSTNAAAMYVPGTPNVTPSGAFTYSVPIVVPPGAAGMAPSLSLNYSSQAGDGFEGLGWSLGGISAITRCPRTLAQDGIHGGVNYDAGTGGDKTNDRFCLDGQRLMLVSGHYGAENSVYHTEIESFTKVIAKCDVAGACTTTNGPDWFEVHTKSGRILQFGNTTASANYSRIFITNPPPGSLPIVREWLENNVQDLSNNYYTITYNSGLDGYPTVISYTGHTSSPAVTPYNEVKFIYAARSNTYKVYQAGSWSELTKLLTNIETYSGSTLVSNYVIGYNLAAANSAQFNELNSISRCSDSAGTVCLAPTTFGWQGSRDAITVSAGVPINIAQGGTLSPGDWNGDGRTDAIVDAAQDDPCNIYFGTQSNTLIPSSMTASYQKWTNGTGQWVTNQPACFDTFATFTTPPVTDFSGDGYTDLVITQVHNDGDYFQTLKNNQDGTLTQPMSGAAFSIAPESGILAIGDFNGDGLSDIAAPNSSSTGVIYYSNGDGTFKPGTDPWDSTQLSVTVGDFDGDGCADHLDNSLGSKIYYSCQPAVSTYLAGLFGTILVGDFNGDGKDDIINIDNSGNTNLYFSTGTGLTSAIALPTSGANDTIYQGDFNGDGKLDVALIAGSGSCSTIWLGTGNGFVQANDAHGNPVCFKSPGSFVLGAVIADWNNDGADDIWIQSNPDTNGVGDEQFFISYVPELISTVSNGLCGSHCPNVTVAYDRLNHGTIYTKGSGAGYPTQDVINASYVVSTISSNNGIGGVNSVGYAYAGAKEDLQGRGFLGFTTVTATDSRTGIVTTTTFNTAFPLSGTLYEQAITYGTAILSDTRYTFTATTPTGFTNVVQLTEKNQKHHYDLNGTTKMPVSDTTFTYDSYGSPHVVTVSVYATESASSPSSTTTQTTTWTNDSTNWILGQPLTKSIVQTGGTTGSLTRDWAYTTDPDTGLVTEVQVQPGDSLELDGYIVYDAFGNLHTIKQKAPGGSITTRTTTLNYDSQGQFLASVNYPTPSSGVALTESFTYDARFGSTASHTNVNGQTTYANYDGFGRVVSTVNPDNTGVQYTYNYCSGINGGTTACGTYGAYFVDSLPVSCSDPPTCDTGTAIGSYVNTERDLLQRTVLTDTQGFDGSLVKQSTAYDAQLHVHKTSRPIFSGGTYAYTSYSYDPLDRVTEADFPDGSKTTTTYVGLVTSVTNDLGQTTTTTLNPQGWVASVEDAGSGTTTYAYDSFGNPTLVTSPGGHTITNTFDDVGRRKTFADSDFGNSAWQYTYDALSELLTQTDAKSQLTTYSYDVVGRPTSRVEADMTSTWNWDTATNGVGELAQACNATSCTGASYVYTPGYNSLGRVNSDTLAINGTNYAYTMSYDTDGRLHQVTYPSGLRIDYGYTSLSYLSSLTDHATGSTVWTANAADAELHLTQSTAGNGLITNNTFDLDTGRLETIDVGSSTNPHSLGEFSYQWDTVGNLTSREDLKENYTESFCYDELNRLTSYGLTTSSACPVTVSGAVTLTYGSQGDIKSKSDVGAYDYGGNISHQVQSITGTVEGVTNPSFFYDGNGNMHCMTEGTNCTAPYNRHIGWTSFNMVSQVTDNITGNQFGFVYDTNHARIEQCSPTCASPTSTLYYLNDPATGAMEEVTISGANTTTNDYIQAGGSIVAMRNLAVGVSTYQYFNGDHLGSISLISDASGNLVGGGRQSYDAWGLRRNKDGTPAASCSAISSASTRGFTQQEETNSSCQVNLNARMYDPVVGRFWSPDAIVPNPLNTQSYNRYAYVNNRPLSAIDPSGYDPTPPNAPPQQDPNLCNPEVSDCAALLSSGGGEGSAAGGFEADLNQGSGNAGDASAPMDTVTVWGAVPYGCDGSTCVDSSSFDAGTIGGVDTVITIGWIVPQEKANSPVTNVLAIGVGAGLGGATIFYGGLITCVFAEPCGATAAGIAAAAFIGGALGGAGALAAGVKSPGALLVSSYAGTVLSGGTGALGATVELSGGGTVLLGATASFGTGAATTAIGEVAEGDALDAKAIAIGGFTSTAGYLGGGQFALDASAIGYSSTGATVAQSLVGANSAIVTSAGVLVSGSIFGSPP